MMKISGIGRRSFLALSILIFLTACVPHEEVPVVEPDSPKVVLEVWHLWIAENDGNAVAFGKALEAYKAIHPEVEIRIDSTENEAYKTKLKTAFSANEAPDVFFAWGAGFAEPLVNAGMVEVITDHLDPSAISDLDPYAASNFIYDGQLYGLPFVTWAGVLYCNEEMFLDAGVKLPETIDDLTVAIDGFRERGTVPMALGAKDAWTAMFYQNAATIRTAGKKLTEAALNKEVSYNTGAFIEGAQLVIDLIERGAFDEDTLALSTDEAKVSFLNGETPMIYQGSWMTAEIQNPLFSKVAGKVVAKNFPGIDGGDYNNQLLGGAIDGLMMSKACNHKAEAAEFIAFVTKYMAKESFIQGSGLPAWKVDVPEMEVDPLVSQIMDIVRASEGSVVAWDTYLSGNDAIWHLALIQELFAGNLSAEEFAKEMQKLNERDVDIGDFDIKSY